jgi:hypothetical protein
MPYRKCETPAQSRALRPPLRAPRVQLKLVNCILTVSLLLRSPKKDVQLKTLQSLAAHMKLLLDCPEQFWRLLEAREYLDAAWLFLVARVVHHSLVDEDEDDVWTDQGIDVLVQFPLVQRQWDAINGFLNQISHRAIQSLREEMTVQVGPEDE